MRRHMHLSAIVSVSPIANELDSCAAYDLRPLLFPSVVHWPSQGRMRAIAMTRRHNGYVGATPSARESVNRDVSLNRRTRLRLTPARIANIRGKRKATASSRASSAATGRTHMPAYH